jgi:hypothetical protein
VGSWNSRKRFREGWVIGSALWKSTQVCHSSVTEPGDGEKTTRATRMVVTGMKSDQRRRRREVLYRLKFRSVACMTHLCGCNSQVWLGLGTLQVGGSPFYINDRLLSYGWHIVILNERILMFDSYSSVSLLDYARPASKASPPMLEDGKIYPLHRLRP